MHRRSLLTWSSFSKSLAKSTDTTNRVIALPYYKEQSSCHNADLLVHFKVQTSVLLTGHMSPGQHQ